MDKTKAAISNFVSKAGHHDTTIHEQVKPHVTHEAVQPTRHEEVNTAVDKEVHQDHHHHTVQPIHDKEILPEQHKHQVHDVEHREFDHRDHEHTKSTLAAESQKIQDKRVVHDTTHTQSSAPVAHGEHVHHHVHETIQPVVHKETIQPSVVHTTVPVHEVHHNAAKHHTTSQLPAVSMAEFKQKGGSLSHSERTHAFDGCPEGVHSDGNHTGTGTHSGTGTHTSTGNNLGTGNSMGTQGMSTSTTGAGHSHSNKTATGDHITDSHQGVGAGTQGKPSLLQKLNPMKDADGDGKKGFMD